jgi:hypothetical protein
VIDFGEFGTLYGDAKVTEYMELSTKIGQLLRARETQAHNRQKFAKVPLNNDEIMDYPYFFRLKKHNLNLNQNKLSNFKPRRTLSIVASKFDNNLSLV